ncbi:histidine phosphatase family protein [Clostridium lundense]|uniref:histidine phosphatase family protein n=1 Tax=Clostridium lundense TaxID=319475 RepID=UPI00048897ED|nr:histidine phosphatase family protein [Clostridium lundense]
MTTTLFITRHGQTMWNTEKRMQGWKDSPLTEAGINQATWLRDRIKNTNIDYIYASPIGRAYRTAEIVRGNRDVPIITDDRIREINMGVWEGLAQEEIDSLYKEQLFNFWNAPHLYEPIQGESFIQVRERTSEFIEEMAKKHPGQNIFIVTHTIALKSIMSYIQDIPLEKFWGDPYIHPTSLTVVKIDGENREVLMHADASHIKNLKEIKVV